MKPVSTLPIETVSNQKPRHYRGTLGDWLGLLKSIIWQKLFWGPEIPNAETIASFKRAEDDYKNGRGTSFSNAKDAVAWLRSQSGK